MTGIVIVGSGHAGGRAAEAIRKAGWSGELTLIGDEPIHPYERPPLSKGVLAGQVSVEDGSLFAPAFFDDNAIAFRAGARAVGLKPKDHQVILESGEVIPYTKLLLATGSRPRDIMLPGSGLPGVLNLRQAKDARMLRQYIQAGSRVLIVGGGFIGLEVAATARQCGCEVTIVEAGPRLLTRAVPASIAERVRAEHVDRGVEILFERQVSRVVGATKAEGLVLSDGTILVGDVVVVGVGIQPNVELALDAGLAIDNGIVVDDRLQSSDPDIFAAGDVCSFLHQAVATRVRLENWQNANEQGAIAGRNMIGADERIGLFGAVPWMWSDQYDLTVQIVGFPQLGSETIERDLGDGSLIGIHLNEQGLIVGAAAFGSLGRIAKPIRIAQKMIANQLHPDRNLLADPSQDLRQFIRASETREQANV